MQVILTPFYSVLTERCHYVILALGALSHPPALCLYYVNVWRVSPGGRGPKNVSVSGQTHGAANFQLDPTVRDTYITESRSLSVLRGGNFSPDAGLLK